METAPRTRLHAFELCLLAVSGGGCGDDAEVRASRSPIYVCGNGVLERGEECDDGNLSDGDRCSAECKVSKVDVGITVNTCPAIGSYTVSPARIPTGYVATARVEATDADDDPLTYVWTATSGTFTLPDQPETGYECDALGGQVLNIVVDDGRNCHDELNLSVICLAAEQE